MVRVGHLLVPLVLITPPPHNVRIKAWHGFVVLWYIDVLRERKKKGGLRRYKHKFPITFSCKGHTATQDHKTIYHLALFPPHSLFNIHVLRRERSRVKEVSTQISHHFLMQGFTELHKTATNYILLNTSPISKPLTLLLRKVTHGIVCVPWYKCTCQRRRLKAVKVTYEKHWTFPPLSPSTQLYMVRINLHLFLKSHLPGNSSAGELLMATPI